jgi:hypothetical protein
VPADPSGLGVFSPADLLRALRADGGHGRSVEDTGDRSGTRGRGAAGGWKTIMTVGSILCRWESRPEWGLAFGIYAALRAARLNWIRALRHEKAPFTHAEDGGGDSGEPQRSTTQFASRSQCSIFCSPSSRAWPRGCVAFWGRTAPRLTQNTDKLQKMQQKRRWAALATLAASH